MNRPKVCISTMRIFALSEEMQ